MAGGNVGMDKLLNLLAWTGRRLSGLAERFSDTDRKQPGRRYILAALFFFFLPVLFSLLLNKLLNLLVWTGRRLSSLAGRFRAIYQKPLGGRYILTALNLLAWSWRQLSNLAGRLSAVDHKHLGRRYILTALFFFLLAGRDSLRMRIQLAQPRMDFLSPQDYNELFTMHGTVMMFLFVMPILIGFGIYLIPLMIGARDLAFPRLSAFGYWCFLFGGLFLYSSLIVDAVPDRSWSADVPLTGPEFSPGNRIDYWLLGLTFVELSFVVAAITLIVSILRTRAPGMSLNRMPLFVWAVLVMAVLIPIGFLPLLAGSALLELERITGAQFFDPKAGGNPLLWQHFFWVADHLEVFLMPLPALGAISMIVPTFSRRPIVGYNAIVLAIAAIGLLGSGLWLYHMFVPVAADPVSALGWPAIPFASASIVMVTTAMGLTAWLATIRGGRFTLASPVLWLLGFLVMSVIGVISAVLLGLLPFDRQGGGSGGSYVAVAHLHYVAVGGVVFPFLAAFHYWYPKVTGRLLSEGLAKIAFWLAFLGANLTFLPQFLAGLMGMPRGAYTYDASLGVGLWNLLSTIGAFIFVVGILVFVISVVWSRIRGPRAGNNPWHASTLEWAITSPPPPYNFRVIPTMVQSRDPLWEQPEVGGAGSEWERPSPGAERGEPEPPVTPYETYGTSMRNAHPECVISLAGPSFWPLILAIAVALSLAGILVDRFSATGLGALVGIVALAGWLWPGQKGWKMDISDSAGAGELPCDVSDRRATGWWGMLLAVLCQAVLLVSIVFAYVYLWSDAAVWPPQDIERPSLLVSTIGTAILVASLVPMSWAYAGIRRGDQRQLKLGLAMVFAFGGAFLALVVYQYRRQPFDLETNAYASVFLTANAFIALQVGAALVISALVQLWAWLGHYNAQRFLAVRNTALNWYATVGSWLIVFLVLYLSPYIVG